MFRQALSAAAAAAGKHRRDSAVGARGNTLALFTLLATTTTAAATFAALSRPNLAHAAGGPLTANPASGEDLTPLPLKKVSYFAARGPRATMEDRMFFSPDNRFFAVYDGHGGHSVAELARKYLYLEFLTELIKLTDEVPVEVERVMRAFHSSFTTFSDHIISNPSLDYEGSTAIVVYLTEDDIITANVGDSRAILCRGSKAVELSVDHKPNHPAERKRIEELGGTVRWHGFTGPDKMPVPGMGAYRMNNNLSLSRAFGDHLEMPFVTALPDVLHFPRKHGADRFIVLASDGLWDVMTSQEVVDFVRQIMAKSSSNAENTSPEAGNVWNAPSSSSSSSSATSSTTTAVVGSSRKEKSELEQQQDRRMGKMAKFLVEEALRRQSADNVTAVVIWL